MKKELITCITGQDGSYLSEILLDKGYEVHGAIRRSSSFNPACGGVIHYLSWFSCPLWGVLLVKKSPTENTKYTEILTLSCPQ